MKGQARVLYRLPAIVEARAAGRVVFIAEGEKDCDALASLNLAATCNPGGAGKWKDQYAEALSGAKVIILPDKDTPGRNHAALVLKSLTGKAESVRVVELPNYKGNVVKDPADWIVAHQEAREIAPVDYSTWAGEPDTFSLFLCVVCGIVCGLSRAFSPCFTVSRFQGREGKTENILSKNASFCLLKWCARLGSNQQPSAPEADALSN